MNLHPDLSFLVLITQASVVVQAVLLLLVILSLWSWWQIFLKLFQLKRASRDTDAFEDAFWKGGELAELYQRAAQKPGGGLEHIFTAGFREYSKHRKQGSSAAVTLVTADPSLQGLVEPYADLLRDELNVKEIRWAADRTQYVHHEVKPIFPKTGPRFGKKMPEVKKALDSGDGDALAAELERTGKITIQIPDGPADLSAEEVEVRLVERAGTATQGDRELLVALETELSPELVAEGLAREFVHWVQQERPAEVAVMVLPGRLPAARCGSCTAHDPTVTDRC